MPGTQREVNGYRMWVEDGGRGLPLVLIHAFPLDHHVWKDVRDGLVEDYRVILYDMRGFGRSTATEPPYTMELLADDLVALLDTLDIDRALVGGISMGGYVALSVLRHHAERVKGLALVATRAGTDTPAGRQSRDEMADLARRAGTSAVVDSMVPKLLSETVRSDRPDIVERVRRIGAQASTDGVVGALMAIRDRPDSFAVLGRISIPSLVLVGDEDPITPPAESEAMAAAIPGALLRTVQRAGHLVTMEKPDEVTRALRELLDRCR